MMETHWTYVKKIERAKTKSLKLYSYVQFIILSDDK